MGRCVIITASQRARSYMPQKPIHLLSTVESSLPTRAFTLIQEIAQRAFQLEMPLYLVGGPVRDVLLGIPVRDLDLVVEGNASTLAALVATELQGQLSAYTRFGTATLRLEGQRFDLATARRETYTRPGALPKVTPSTIQEDLGRRDFSINAMAISLNGPRPGRLLDPFTGKADLKHRLVRVLHPGCFVDDATRILRAVRYEQRLNFKLEAGTKGLLMKAVEGGMLGTVSGDRMRRELDHIFREKCPYLAVTRAGDLGILEAIHPPLGDGSAAKDLAACAAGDSPLFYLAGLSYPLTVEEGEAFIHRLRMPTRWARVVRDTITVRLRSDDSHTDRPYIGQPDLSPGQLSRLLEKYSPIGLRANAMLTDSLQVKEDLKHYLTVLHHVETSLDGRDLIALGVAQGPQVGEVLRELKDARIDGTASSREDEIRLTQEYLANRGG